MKRKSLGLVMIGLFALTFAAPSPAADSSSWDFTVYLNDKKIGKHRFKVTDTGDTTRVQSEANFKYTILLIPAFRYEHRNAEQWAGNCLMRFEAQTNSNGDQISVFGERAGGSFTVQNGDEPVALPDCIMSFAYWNPEFLDQPQLLNPQTGEYVNVTVEAMGDEMLQVRGKEVEATRFRLTAYEVDLTLWYSKDDEWLALESIARGKHVIRYELS